MKLITIALMIGCTLLSSSEAFAPSHSNIRHNFCGSRATHTNTHANTNKPVATRPTLLQLQNTPSERHDDYDDDDDDDDDASKMISETCWSPGLRRIMGGIASLGVLETSFLTWNKLQGPAMDSLPFCGADGGVGSCSDVLNGPYAVVPYTEIPLSAVGMMAYLTVLGLSVIPLISSSTDNQAEASEDTNRVLLMGVTTAMGTFSIFLLTLLFGVLHQDCPYCELSATLSILMALLAWIGGCMPEENQEMAKKGAQMTASGFMMSTVLALSLFIFADGPLSANASMGNFGSNMPSTILADGKEEKNLPPPITQESSDRAISLAKDLQALDAKMFGAYWCSHCYDQKESLGKQAFSKIPYIECSKDGVNQQYKLCRSKDVPGYPTWEINGKLYPGEQTLEELEEVVTDVKKGMIAQ
ncbi:MAG: hypothetical protein SGBAC_011562 [Bacillariaceae sp.]